MQVLFQVNTGGFIFLVFPCLTQYIIRVIYFWEKNYVKQVLPPPVWTLFNNNMLWFPQKLSTKAKVDHKY